MLEIPEAVAISRQIVERTISRQVVSVTAGAWPHKFAWYYGEKESYAALATGAAITDARAVGGMLEVELGAIRMLFSEGARLRLHGNDAKRPTKHQLLVELDDGSALSASIQMYGGIGIFPAGACDNAYYQLSLKQPSPLTAEFDAARFSAIVDTVDPERTSLKALLATEQRIPGLGNGVLQDILFHARLHPATPVAAMPAGGTDRLFASVKSTLTRMAERGGRDTELDLDGRPGGYATIMSRLHLGEPCPACSTPIEKASYMGGAVYFCPSCQPRL